MKYLALSILLIALIWQPALAAQLCLPPTPPPPTTAELASKYRNEFQAEFERYFDEAGEYFICVEKQRRQAHEESANVAARYELFLQDFFGEGG